MAIFTGAGTAIVTPMNADESVNYDAFGELLEEQIAGGIDAVIVCGTTGESATLSEKEHMEVIRYAIRKVAKRIPVIAGTGSNSTKTAIELSQDAEKAGADAVLLVTPYYNKATQNGLIKHFTRIAQSISIPVILYNVPSRTGVNLQPETIAYLAEHVENITAVKEASGNISQIAKLMSLAGDRIDLYSGNDDQIVPILSLGGKGVISVLSNIAPQQTHDIVADFLAGDVKKSCREQLRAMELINALFCEVNPIPVKTAMNLMGKHTGPLRGPLCEMEDKNKERLVKAMKEYGILS